MAMMLVTLPAHSQDDTLTTVPGLKVGHFTLSERPTGGTVVLAEGGAVGGVDVWGGLD
jgi:L-aminopeptidase/D-esterase-like protein